MLRLRRLTFAAPPMRRKIIAARIARVVALGSAAALLVACNEATAPTPQRTPPAPVAAVPAAMANVANSVDDMTEWWMPSIENESERSNLQQILTGLKSHLNVGNVLACQQEVSDARGALSRLSDSQQVETAPIGVALDIVQSALDGLSK
jgi:hypothetical protein